VSGFYEILTRVIFYCIKPLNIKGYIKAPESELFEIAESQQSL